MTEHTDTPAAWTQVWLDAQRQFLDVWQQLSQHGNAWQAHSLSPFPSAPANLLWGEPFNQWSRIASLALPAADQNVATRFAQLGRSYLQMGETLWHLFQQGQDISQLTGQWSAALNQTLEQMRAACTANSGGADPWSGFAACWGLPLDNWRQIAVSFSPFPGKMEKALTVGTPGIPSSVEHMLDLPPVGYAREWQEQLQELARLSLEYSKALQDFGQLLGKVLQRALHLMTDRLTKLIGEGESVDGLRAAYDIWIDSGEEAYAEFSVTPEFSKLQAEMVNALMRLKRHEQRMTEQVMTGMNMPTRQELDTSHRHVHELRREVRKLEDHIEDTEAIDKLWDQLEELRGKLSVSKARSSSATVRTARTTSGTRKTPTPTRKTPARKKARTAKAAPSARRKTQPKKKRTRT